MPSSVRAAVEADLDAVLRLAAEWVAEDVTYGMTVPSRDWFRSGLAHYFFVATADGSTIGYSQGEVHTSDESVTAVLPIGSPFVDITNIYVSPSHRHRGVGGDLLQAVLSAAANDGVERALLFTGTKDVLTIVRFYERHGFKGWGVQMVR
jgi:ribosomal protein S18 acetylase RimI-like enzyme